MQERWLNKHKGVVRSVSPDCTKITIGLPRGGTATAQNEGFDVGDAVCFTLDPSGRRVLRVLPKDVADAKVEIACSETLQHAIMEPDNPIEQEEYDGDPTNQPSDGQEIEECLNHHCRKAGDDVSIGGNHTTDPDHEDTGIWPGGQCYA